MIKSKPKYLFLDTQVFEEANLNFESRHFVRLKELVADGEVQILLSDIVASEVKNHISRYVSRAKDAVRQTGRGVLMRNLKKKANRHALEEPYWNDVEAELQGQFSQFCLLNKVEILAIGEEHSKTVFGWYFRGEAPFDVDERKSEFPDAFALAAAEQWSRRRKKRIFVVSRDGAFKSGCAMLGKPEQLVYAETLPAFFSSFPDPSLAAALREALTALIDEDYEFGASEFLEFDFFVSESESLDAEDVYVLYSEAYKLHVVEAGNGKAIVEADLFVTFNTTISKVRKEVEDRALVTAEISLEYDPTDPSKIVIKRIKFDRDYAVEVSASSVLPPEMESE